MSVHSRGCVELGQCGVSVHAGGCVELDQDGTGLQGAATLEATSFCMCRVSAWGGGQ